MTYGPVHNCLSERRIPYGPVNDRLSVRRMSYGPVHDRLSVRRMTYGLVHDRLSVRRMPYGPVHARLSVYLSRVTTLTTMYFETLLQQCYTCYSLGCPNDVIARNVP
jgi:hypothetical protein